MSQTSAQTHTYGSFLTSDSTYASFTDSHGAPHQTQTHGAPRGASSPNYALTHPATDYGE